MTTTIETMKQLQQIIAAVFRDPQNITRYQLDEMKRIVGDAVSSEEAQGVEPVEYQIQILGNRWAHCAKHLYKPGSEMFRALYTRPSQPANTELLAGKLELMTAERDKLLLEVGELRALRALRPATQPAGEQDALCYRLKEMAKAMTSYGYAGCADLCIEAADTLAAPQPAGDRAALIKRRQEIAGFSHIYESDRRAVREAADMLAADAQKSEPTEQKLPEFFASYEYAPDFSVLVSVYRRRSDALPELVHQESLVAQASIGQQVAAPQIDAVGAALDLEARAKTVESQTTERAMLHAANCLRMLAAAPRPPNGACDSPELCKLNGECAGQYGTKQKCTAAPQPPQADALAADHAEDVRAMVPMTDQDLNDLLPTNDSMSRKDSQRWIARATERHHRIISA